MSFSRPLHRAIYPILRERIERGTYPEGAPLPPQATLAKELGVSLATLRQAIELLEREGLIYRRHGLGTFATRPKRGRVLVVDDDPDIRDILVTLVEEAGFQADEAADGLEAIDRVKEARYDRIFLDLRMPKYSGLQALPQLRLLAPDTLVIVITAFPRDLTSLANLDEWPLLVIRKPFETSHIQRVLRLQLAADSPGE